MKQWLRREEDRKTCWTSDHFSNLLLFAKMADQTTIFQLKYWNCSLRLFAKTATEQLSAATQGATRSAWRPFSRVVHRRAAVRFALIYAYMMLLLCFVQIRQTCRYADVARSPHGMSTLNCVLTPHCVGARPFREFIQMLVDVNMFLLFIRFIRILFAVVFEVLPRFFS